MQNLKTQGEMESRRSVEMTDMNVVAPPVRTATASPRPPGAASVARGGDAAPEFASLPASPVYASREGLMAGVTNIEGSTAEADGLRIRVWYLDDVLTRAEPKFVPDVASLKQLLPERDLAFPMSASPTYTGDHFAEVPYTHHSSPPAACASSNPALDALESFPLISLRPSAPTNSGGHAAWVSVKAPSQRELKEILDWLPIHVLTRRRILDVLCTGDDDDDDDDDDGDGDGDGGAAPATRGDVDAKQRATNRRSGGQAANPTKTRSGLSKRSTSRLSRRSGGRNEPTQCSEDSDDTSDDDDDNDNEESHGPHNAGRENFLEYFPAHGYAVLCLQAVPMPKGESTRRGATPKEELLMHGTQVPSTPVVALAFESTLFTFSLSRFGGEGDVRLIVANHVASPSSHGSRHGMPARVTTIATLSSMATLGEQDRSARNASQSVGDGMGDLNVAAFNSSISPVGTVPHSTRPDASTAAAVAAGRASHPNAFPPPLLFYPRQTSATASGSSQSRHTETPTTMSGANWSAATAISVVCSSLISAIIAYLQQSTRSLLMEADQLDELVLQILPSRVDQDDMLVRTKSIRNLIAAFHIDALQKERVLKQLLLPAMRQTPLAQSTQAIERYQRSLSSLRSTVLKLRKGRDIVNMASMTLISGVSARLLSHCNFMDYLNHVQTQIAVVVMPIAVIPGIFATNVMVPWEESTSMIPFYTILSITLALMIAGVAPPLYKFYVYRYPKALAPLE